MTATPETLPAEQFDKKPERITRLEDMFELGYTRSDPVRVYADPATGLAIDVQYRTLTTVEIRDIFEQVHTYQDPIAQVITEKLETLARAIVAINNMPLVLDTKDREDFVARHKREPTTLDMARVIVIDKIKSVHVVELLYAEYQEFLETVKTHFDDIKKKLKRPPTSS